MNRYRDIKKNAAFYFIKKLFLFQCNINWQFSIKCLYRIKIFIIESIPLLLAETSFSPYFYVPQKDGDKIIRRKINRTIAFKSECKD